LSSRLRSALVSLALACAVATPALAQLQGTVNVVWTANVEPDLAGYRLYADIDPNIFNLLPAQAAAVADRFVTLGPAATSASLQLTAGQTWFLALTAFDLSGNESGFSTVRSTTPSLTPTVRTLSQTSMRQGQSALSVTISGDNFSAGATVSFGAGITVGAVNSTGAPSTLVTTLSADPLAQVATRTVSVTNVGGGVGSKPNGFSVTVNLARLDLDGSNRIDNGDLIILLLTYPSVSGDGIYVVGNDLDVDGRINGADIAIFFANFGRVGPFP